jgi:hypothetical protein
VNTPDWNDLTSLWQSSAAAAPARDIIARQKRLRWMTHVAVAAEVIVCVLGWGMAVWLLTLATPYAVAIGIGVLAFTTFAAAATLWARTPKRPGLEASVTTALDVAIGRARVGVRWGLAGFWIVAASLAFLTLVALLWATAPAYPAKVVRAVLLSFAFGAAWTGLWQAFLIVYYLRKVRELARLEEAKRALGD